MPASSIPPWRGVSAAWTAAGVARATMRASETTVTRARRHRDPTAIWYLPFSWSARERSDTDLAAHAIKGGGTCQHARPVKWAVRSRGSVLGQPHVLQLLVRVVIGRRHVVLHLGPVHDAAGPPEAGDVVRVLEHDLLELVDQLLALGRVEGPGLAGVEVVDARVAEATPVVGVPGSVALEEQVRIVRVVEDAVDDHLE